MFEGCDTMSEVESGSHGKSGLCIVIGMGVREKAACGRLTKLPRAAHLAAPVAQVILHLHAVGDCRFRVRTSCVDDATGGMREVMRAGELGQTYLISSGEAVAAKAAGIPSVPSSDGHAGDAGVLWFARLGWRNRWANADVQDRLGVGHFGKCVCRVHQFTRACNMLSQQHWLACMLRPAWQEAR